MYKLCGSVKDFYVYLCDSLTTKIISKVTLKKI